MTQAFIRDDDVGELTEALRAFVSVFLDRRIPVSYQIIPEKFTAECAKFLLDARRDNPGLVDFGQHGLRHEMTVRGRREFYEFGPERSYEQQRTDIRAGRTLLRERLGDDSAAAVFTPPRHRYDRNTLRALQEEGFSVLSSSAYADPAHRAAYAFGRTLGLTNIGRGGVAWHGRRRPDCGLLELSITIGVDDGSAIVAPVETVMATVERARRHRPIVGLMFHHPVYDSAKGLSYLGALADRLVAPPALSFHGIGELASGLEAANG